MSSQKYTDEDLAPLTFIANTKKKGASVKTLSKSNSTHKNKAKKSSELVNNNVQIVTVTVSQIRNAAKKKDVPDSQKLRQLVRIPSNIERSKIYKEAAEAIAENEAQALHSHGGRPWKCEVIISDSIGASSNLNGNLLSNSQKGNSKGDAPRTSMKERKKKKKVGPLFRWYRGNLELACLPHLYEKIEVMNEVQPPSKLCDYYDVEDWSNKKTDLQERQITNLSTFAWNDTMHPIPNVERKWISPDLATFRTRSSAMEHAIELLRRDKLIDRVLHGYGARGVMLKPTKPSKKQALDAGYYRFLRDGLWVIGQEEDWLEERVEVLEEKEAENIFQKIESKCSLVRTASEESTEREKDNNDITRDSLDELKISGGILGIELYVLSKWDEYIAVNANGEKETDNLEENSKNQKLLFNRKAKDFRLEFSSLCESERKKWRQRATSGKSPLLGKEQNEEFLKMLRNSSGVMSSVVTDSGTETSLESRSDAVSSKVGKSGKRNVEKCGLRPSLVSPSPGEVMLEPSDEYNVSKHADANTTPRRKARNSRQVFRSGHWRLNNEQIILCFNAVMEHYEKVMYTVRARALYSELSDGFDVFRERGRGRYDMTLPIFDRPAFNFLTSLKHAAWMPVVRKILGDDATLVHKGAFLSIQGSETQVYHQDGPHLTTKYQRPCHAINVFIPLVDLHKRNGPTEFCLGTHFLGYENFSKEMVEIPLVKAGTPVIFDYRLGHRGLGNTSDQCRPIVYLTYTSASSEFRDSVNFSKRRYRKLGDLIDKPLSREERALKRKREI